MRFLYIITFSVLIFGLAENSNAQVTIQKFTLLDNTDTVDSYTPKSPRGAVIRSLIIPGWGQAYNRKFIKALVFLGGESYFISRYLELNDELKVLENTSSVSSLDIENKEQERNGWGWLFAAGYLLAMGDAFVDAHLDGVSIDDNISVKLINDKQKSGISMQLQLNF